MAQDKQRPGFMVYFTDWDMPRKILNAEDFKSFFDAVFCYAQDGEVPPSFDNQVVSIFFNSFATKLNADNERYQEKCRKASEAAKKSHANASERKQPQADAANTNNNPNSKRIPKQYQPESEYQNQSQYQPESEYQSQSQNSSQRTQADAEEECYRKQLESSRYYDEDLPF